MPSGWLACGRRSGVRTCHQADRVASTLERFRCWTCLGWCFETDLTRLLHRYTVSYTMSPKEFTAFRIDPEVLDALREIKEREGVPLATQVNFALREWLQKRGVVLKKPERKRGATRKRS